MAKRRPSGIRDLRTIRAYAGDELRIDLTKELTGEIRAWMVRVDEYNSNFPNRREFDIIDNRYIVMPKERMVNCRFNDCEIEQLIAGEWYFDVSYLKDGATCPRTILTGIIDITGDITDSIDSFNIFEIFNRNFNDSFE